MNASFFVPFSAKLRQSETCSVLLMSDVSSKMIAYHPLARTSFVAIQLICSSSFCITDARASEAGYRVYPSAKLCPCTASELVPENYL